MYIIPYPGRKHKVFCGFRCAPLTKNASRDITVNRNNTSAESGPVSLATAPSLRYTVL